MSTLLDGQVGVSDVCLSLPTLVGREGVEGVLLPAMDEAEAEAFRHSGQVLKEAAEQAGL